MSPTELVTNKRNKNMHVRKSSTLREFEVFFFFFWFVMLHLENNAPVQALIYTECALPIQCLSQKQTNQPPHIFQKSISSIKVHITIFWLCGDGISFPQLLILQTLVLIQLFDTQVNNSRVVLHFFHLVIYKLNLKRHKNLSQITYFIIKELDHLRYSACT